MDRIELPPIGRRRAGGQELDPQRSRRWIDAALIAMLFVFAAAWIVAIVQTVRTGGPRPRLSGVLANPLSPDGPPPTPYLLDAALRLIYESSDVAGASGAVKVLVVEPGQKPGLADTLPEGVSVQFVTPSGDTVVPGDTTPPPGIWNVLLRARGEMRLVPDLTVLSMVPLSEKRSGRIGRYVIGTWPNETGGTPRSEAYRPPRGMVRVTPENLDVPVSRHFLLRHFVTKGQENVWPKYVLISPRLLDKLELMIDELNRTGTPVRSVGVISGFRTPSYNAGGGDTGGRGALSRHMYGDAMDWFVDNDGDGRMDDLNGDGDVDIGDGRVMIEAGERVERAHPELVGGLGLYAPTGAHAGFVHVDTRGYRARW